ncbi:hypothetical protein PPSIR1_30325 [Plesiocystis pacifica SIR-1]|uniref:Uncharacterized protein n=1 Tax=Plesiocystis pacifica SIR-1 TaxID=391625 RepID=A6FZ44_9BACT|nr:hypothetical protein [Plesiocystis pacifica]EDM81199.1 hypothetical protein PPSIR1_30325 [Plesiocystis pacifica SIR-1]
MGEASHSREVEIELPCRHEGLRLRRELVSGRWVLDGWGRRVVAREWRWGERRRLLEACVEDGRLDAERFVSGLVALLCEPVPPVELHPLYAHLLLELLGVDGQRGLPRLDAVELALARDFGWTAGQLAREGAVGLDRLARSLEPGTARPPAPAVAPPELEGPPPGWKRIVIQDD